jgi:peptidoglycan-N-acetylglucosamine deacetylase
LLATVDTGSAPVRRRLLLAVGALALLDGCTHPAAAHWKASPTGSNLPGDSHPEPSPSGPSPSPSSAWQVPNPTALTPGVCPTVPGVVQHPGGPQHYLPCQSTNIALTIDDGPDPRWTPQILTLLARYQIRATFCMIGRHAAAYPDLVRAVSDGGHRIANHTYTHPIPLTRLPPAQIAAQLGQATDAITAAHAPRPTLFRAPGGEWSPTILAACAAAGMRPLDWSVDPRDWSRPGVPHIVDTILTRTRPGSIILDHDGGGDRQQTIDALTIALPRLIAAGYHFTQP